MRHIKLTQLLIKKTKIYQIYSSIAPIKNRKLKFRIAKNQQILNYKLNLQISISTWNNVQLANLSAADYDSDNGLVKKMLLLFQLINYHF